MINGLEPMSFWCNLQVKKIVIDIKDLLVDLV